MQMLFDNIKNSRLYFEMTLYQTTPNARHKLGGNRDVSVYRHIAAQLTRYGRNRHAQYKCYVFL